MKNLLILLMLIPLVIIARSESTYNKDFDLIADIPEQNDERFIPVPDDIEPDTTGMSIMTSVELSEKMVPGWNVGNCLEATPGGETSWGNPLISQVLIDSVKAAGFKAIRIPVAWSKFSDTSTYTIKTELLERVKEVIDYVLNDSMYAIINCHWDGGWMQPTYAMQDYVNYRLAVMWEQIAMYFRDYDHRLLFAGTNEVTVEGYYGPPNTEYAAVQNSFNQTFVTTVRSTGGRNVYRYLVVQGFNTNINYTISTFLIPEDIIENRLMVEVHYYDPYNFALNSASNITQWGMYATDPLKTETWANEAYADNQFLKMKTNYVDKGYAVILGEYGAISRLSLGSDELNNDHAEYRKYYIGYITASIISRGLVPFYWDNGYTGDHAFGLFNRATGARVYRDIINAIMVAADSSEVITDVSDDIVNSEMLKLYPNPAKGELNLELYITDGKYCQLYDVNGQIIRVFSVSRGINRYDIHNLKAGLYFVRISTPTGILMTKFLKQ
ncbi:MAG: cellulase family glycosylhydrolase [Bacteroidales bacterium]|nr:cellulase family glycosylhydrolase [Bacteroidales bacterium]